MQLAAVKGPDRYGCFPPLADVRSALAQRRHRSGFSDPAVGKDDSLSPKSSMDIHRITGAANRANDVLHV